MAEFLRRQIMIPDRVYSTLRRYDPAVAWEVFEAIRDYAHYWDVHRNDAGFDLSCLSPDAKAVFLSVYDELFDCNSAYFERCALARQAANAKAKHDKQRKQTRERVNKYRQKNKKCNAKSADYGQKALHVTQCNAKNRPAHNSAQSKSVSCVAAKSVTLDKNGNYTKKALQNCPQSQSQQGIAENCAGYKDYCNTSLHSVLQGYWKGGMGENQVMHKVMHKLGSGIAAQSVLWGELPVGSSLEDDEKGSAGGFTGTEEQRGSFGREIKQAEAEHRGSCGRERNFSPSPCEQRASWQGVYSFASRAAGSNQTSGLSCSKAVSGIRDPEPVMPGGKAVPVGTALEDDEGRERAGSKGSEEMGGSERTGRDGSVMPNPRTRQCARRHDGSGGRELTSFALGAASLSLGASPRTGRAGSEMPNPRTRQCARRHDGSGGASPARGSEEQRGSCGRERNFSPSPCEQRWSCGSEIKQAEAEQRGSCGNEMTMNAPRVGGRDVVPPWPSAPHEPAAHEVLITKGFKIDLADEFFYPYRRADRFLLRGVENWLAANKRGCSVEKRWICKQIYKFAERQGKLEQLLGVSD